MQLTRESKLDIYRTMLLIRVSDLKMIELFKKGEIEGHMLPCLGQEAIPATFAKVYTEQDYLITGHRGGGHYMARGCDFNAMWAELYGKVTGTTRGRGGQIHLMDKDKKALTGNAVVGAHWGIATGVGFVARNRGAITVAVGGEGSTNRGTFHESLNMAAVQNLPILYVVEFNDRQMWNTCEETTAMQSVYQRAAAYGLEGARVDGNDPQAIFDKATEYAEKIRAGGKPCLIECVTGKWTDSVSNVRNTPENLEVIKSAQKDPIARWEKKLRDEQILDDAIDAQIKQGVEDQLKAAIEFAINSDAPDKYDGIDQVFSQPV